MKKIKNKAKYGIYALSCLAAISIAYGIDSYTNKSYKEKDYNYVSKTIIEPVVPVITMSQSIIRPYTATNVKIVKTFYDYKAESKNQQESIVKYDTTYMQNDGVDYSGDANFEVVSVLDGTVISIKEDDLLGKIIEIKNTDKVTTVYSSLKETTVKENDQIKQGDLIGKSGENNIAAELKDHLHFEILINGNSVNPEEYFDKTLSDI